jgi:tryptophanyl-tRNA synthetase
MAKNLADFLAPVYEKRLYFEQHPQEVTAAIEHGDNKARAVAAQTLEEVRKAMNIA